ncbi:16S rRNA (uracil(1498)-N(3))-methyltransferase [Sandaracinus amylolyticus]|uniref:Ribosomal RNA small subunit methyltransferase E n=1 Tax=Sandaracinus amylolyticus TaxID=927083 RepID=A0A0F6SGI7_9BACT|nr:RsmE family RNA methyltransferase [Sandaracinus amylolyticus]AKF08764.1 putative methyltransferase PA5071 [Sandaracinus amylolyticus]
MNLVLIEPDELDAEQRVVLRDARAVHLVRVLAVVAGVRVRVGVIDGAIGLGEVERVERDEVVLRCVLEREIPARPRVDLLLALPRPKVIGRLYGALAQLGIGRLMLTNAAKVERFYFDAHQLDPAYRRAQLIEGLAQARHTRVPEVSVHKSLRALVEDELDVVAPRTTRLLADPGAHPSPHARCAGLEGRVVIAIGPEGGWNDFERALLVSRGFEPVAMGARTLRTDTACVALLALVHDALGT